jgi:Flp pilus assembly protein TadB
MPIPATETTMNGGVGDAAKQVAEHASSIAKLEVELATYELKKKLAVFGIGIGFAVGAAVLALYMLGFALATIAAGLATFLDTWLALLIVTAGLGLVVIILAFLAYRRIKKGAPPLPEQAIEEAKLTTEAIKAP